MIKPGDVFYCFKTVTIIDNGEVCYIRGKRYVSEAMGCITNEGGDKNHEWCEGKMLDEFFMNYTLAKDLCVFFDGSYKIIRIFVRWVGLIRMMWDWRWWLLVMSQLIKILDIPCHEVIFL